MARLGGQVCTFFKKAGRAGNARPVVLVLVPVCLEHSTLPEPDL
jgi:hypothetical protein